MVSCSNNIIPLKTLENAALQKQSYTQTGSIVPGVEAGCALNVVFLGALAFPNHSRSGAYTWRRNLNTYRIIQVA